MKNYISIGKAANILGKTQQTLRNWDKEGVLLRIEHIEKTKNPN